MVWYIHNQSKAERVNYLIIPGNGMTLKTIVLTSLAMAAFASNSILCRFALKVHAMDPGAFTLVRLASGALFLGMITRRKVFWPLAANDSRTWAMPLMLALYALFFSYAYVSLSTGIGALILFGAVQVFMVFAGVLAGERPGFIRLLGMALALAGLVYLVLPGVSAPSPGGACFMALAGASWGIYSLLGKQVKNPGEATAFNFVWSVPLVLVPVILLSGSSLLSGPWANGFWAAVLSGTLTSATGYVIWYAAIQGLTATQAAAVQLTVPMIAASGGMIFLSEAFSIRLLIASAVILSGVGLAVLSPKK